MCDLTTIEEILLRARSTALDAARTELMIQRIRDGAESVRSPVYDGVRVQRCESTDAGYVWALSHIDDLERQHGDQIRAAEQARSDAARLIGILPDGARRDILTLRYLFVQTWEAIAEGTAYSMRQVQRIHKDALNELKECLEGLKNGQNEAFSTS